MSSLLFNLALAELQSVLPENVKFSQFADDILLYISFDDLNEALAGLEEAINSLISWLRLYGLELATEKSKHFIFSRKKLDLLDNDEVRIGETLIPCSPILMYLGIILDRKLTWEAYIDYVAGKALAAVNVIRALGRMSWGASPESLIMVYKGIIRSILSGDQFSLRKRDRTSLENWMSFNTVPLEGRWVV